MVEHRDAGRPDAGERPPARATCNEVHVLKKRLEGRAPLPLLGGLALPGFTDAGQPTCEDQLELLEALAKRLLSCERQLWDALPELPWNEANAATGTQDDTNARAASEGAHRATADDADASRGGGAGHASSTASPNFQLLIASIPSPRSAGSANLVDPAVEGILAAAAEQSYLLNRSWFWPRQSNPTGVPAEKEGQDEEGKPEKTSEEQTPKALAQPECSALLPSVILFRQKPFARRADEQASSRPNWLVVLVVGESSVLGVERYPMRRALMAVPCDKTPRVLGPYFSGSAQTMADALDYRKEQCGSPKQAAMATGTMTVEPLHCLLPGLHFFVDDRIQRRKALVDFVDGTGDDPNETPAPTTDCDASAEKAAGATPSGKSELGNVALLRESDGLAFGKPERDNVGPASVLEISLPVAVPIWRKAHAEADRKRGERVGGAKPPWLREPLDYDPSGADLLPALSPASANAWERKFAGMVDTLREHRILNVGVHLHSLEDTITVAKQLRRAMPEARPMLLLNDRLLLHPEHATELDGALVASPHLDLGPSERDPSDDNKFNFDRGLAQEPAFARDSSRGLHLATRWLLRCTSADKVTCTPEEPKQRTELGVIRRGRIWSIESNQSRAKPRAPVSSWLLAAILAFWTIGLAYFGEAARGVSTTSGTSTKDASESPTPMARAGEADPTTPGTSTKSSSGLPTPMRLLRKFVRKLEEKIEAISHREYRLFSSIFAASLMISAVTATLVNPTWIVLVALGFAVLVWLLRRGFRHRINWASLVSAVSIAVPVPALLAACSMFCDRAIHVTSGVSPLAPLLFASASVLAYSSLRAASPCAARPDVRGGFLVLALAALATPCFALGILFDGVTHFYRAHLLTMEGNPLGWLLGGALVVSYLVAVRSLYVLWKWKAFVRGNLAALPLLPPPGDVPTPFNRAVVDMLTSSFDMAAIASPNFCGASNCERTQSQRDQTDPEKQKLRAVQLAVQSAGWVSALRLPMLRAIVCTSIALFTVTEYPFHPGRVLTVYAATLVLLAVVSCGYIYIGLERHPVLAWVAGKESARPGPTELLRVIFYALVPLVLVFNSYFPELSYELQRWFTLQLGSSP